MIRRAVIVSLVASLFGLALRLVFWPPSLYGHWEETLHVLVLLVFPGEYVAVAAGALGRGTTWMVMLGLNTAFFALLGVLAGLCARRPPALLMLAMVLAGGVSACGWWLAGGELHHVPFAALLIAVAFYWTLLGLVRHPAVMQRSRA